jgi:histidine triad (HIT) family protein
MSDAAASPKHDPSCIFCKIAAGQIPSRKVLETDEFIVFHDIAPWAPVHVLMVPCEHIATLYDAEERHAGMWGRMLALAPTLMRDLGVTNGFRTLINTGPDGLQEVQHVHIHVIGGPRPWAKG